MVHALRARPTGGSDEALPPGTVIGLTGRAHASADAAGHALPWHIASGETLAEIAALEHTTVASLIALNRDTYPGLLGNPSAVLDGMGIRVR